MRTDSDDNNQWSVSSVDEFLQYCCPDCDVKEKNKEKFIKHALSQHPLSANYLGEIIIKEELFEDTNEVKYEIPEEPDCDGFQIDNIPPEPDIAINIIGSDSITQIVHEGKKKWQCNTCLDMFMIKQSAKQHILSVHQGEKEVKNSASIWNESPASRIYKCENCDRTFSQSYFLKHHIRIQECKNQGKHNCKLCDISYSYVYQLKQHKLKTHGISLEEQKNDIYDKGTETTKNEA